MPSGYAIRKNQYYDSVFLMGVNSRLSKAAGVRQTAVLMGSEKNKALLEDLGIRAAAIDAAGANDLSSPCWPTTSRPSDAALEGVDAALLAVEATTTPSEVHTLQDGLRLQPDANLAVLTIPGDMSTRKPARRSRPGCMSSSSAATSPSSRSGSSSSWPAHEACW